MPTPGTSVPPFGPGEQTTRPLRFDATDGAAPTQLHQTMSTGTLLPETEATRCLQDSRIPWRYMRYDRRRQPSNPSRDISLFLFGGWAFLVLRILTKHL